MLRYRIIAALLILSLALFAVSHTTIVQAQSENQPNILVVANSNDLELVHRLVYGPSGGKPLKELPLDEAPKPDQNAHWAIQYQSDKQQYLVVDLKTNKTVRTISEDILGGEGGNAPVLSPSTRYLAYDTLKQTNKDIDWTLHIVDLSTNEERQFAATSAGNENNTSITINGALFVFDWDNTETRVVLTDMLPFSDAGVLGYYLLDISKAQPTDKPVALPNLKMLTDGSYLHFSPDNTEAVFLSEDEKNPIQNFEPTHGSHGPYNTINLVSFVDGTPKVVANTTNGIAIANLWWSDDGKKLYFITGDYASTDYIHAPILNYIDLATNKEIKGTALFSGTDRLDDFRVCGDTIYYVTIPAEKLQIDAVLWAAPLTNLTKRVKLELPEPDLYYSLEGCHS